MSDQTNLTQDQLLFADDQYDECEEHYPYTKFRELSKRLKQKFGISIAPSKLRRDMMRYWVSNCIYSVFILLIKQGISQDYYYQRTHKRSRYQMENNRPSFKLGGRGIKEYENLWKNEEPDIEIISSTSQKQACNYPLTKRKYVTSNMSTEVYFVAINY